MTFELLFIFYIQIFIGFFIYNYSLVSIVGTLVDTKSISSKYIGDIKKDLHLHQRNLKLSTVWPLLVVLLAYEKISK
tara:strand:- start:242 stop:472 length:231 start_codon:yes stop_codon:yes gene_type:complete